MFKKHIDNNKVICIHRDNCSFLKHGFDASKFRPVSVNIWQYGRKSRTR